MTSWSILSYKEKFGYLMKYIRDPTCFEQNEYLILVLLRDVSIFFEVLCQLLVLFFITTDKSCVLILNLYIIYCQKDLTYPQKKTLKFSRDN